MKTTIIIGVLLFCIFGYTSEQEKQLTKQEEEQIKKEIIATDDSIMARLEKFDVLGAMTFYSPEFIAYGSGGEKHSLEQLRKEYLDFYASASSTKWTSYNIDFLSITKEKVIISQNAKNEWVMKNGDKGTIDPSHYTFGFKKTSSGWKLFYHHFSGTYLK
jgi:hypothetical protein